MTYYEKYMKYKKKYLNLRQTGGAEKFINSFNNESVNFDYIDIINDEITLKNNSSEVKFKQIKNISGGSGDTVYLVFNNGVRYVYKLFKVGDKDKQEKDLNEITLHNMFYNYFNVDVIDEYKTKSKQQMNRDWSNILDEEFKKSIEMKNPTELLDGYFYNIFSKINEKV